MCKAPDCILVGFIEPHLVTQVDFLFDEALGQLNPLSFLSHPLLVHCYSLHTKAAACACHIQN